MEDDFVALIEKRGAAARPSPSVLPVIKMRAIELAYLAEKLATY
jgi:hypothetical protein